MKAISPLQGRKWVFVLTLSSACAKLAFTSPPVFHALATSHLLKRFPSTASLEFLFSSQQEVKAATMFLLTAQSDQGAQLARLTFGENRGAAQQFHQQQAQYGGFSNGYGQPESRFQQYGYNSGARAVPQTFDFTESLLATACCYSRAVAVTVDKTVLLETEAAALARLPSLQELRLDTNSSAQPLRRPLLQLMLGSLTGLRVLKLSYIRDTTADMVMSLPRLHHLTKLTLQYAYWGESGAGERVMGGLVKYQKQLAELHLYECGVNDDMLRLIMGITTLRRLHIQDEDADEERCPSNKGLARITQLRRLEQLELFGEEFQLDGELLSRLAQLHALRHLAMAGLDSLQPDDAESPGAQAEGLGAEVEEMDLSSSMGERGPGSGDDEESYESLSGTSQGGDEATSRPQPSRPHNCMRPTERAAAPQPQLALRQGQAQREGAAQAATWTAPPAVNNNNSLLSPHGSQPSRVGGGTSGLGAAPMAPVQVLRRLETLRLYGPSSLCASPPPLALLLPQPQLRNLKLSACASHANLRALSLQAGLRKLIVSHTAVPLLYPVMLPQLHHAGASILGFHCEVLYGLASLQILRIKDLTGFVDSHLSDLAVALCRLPSLEELKLRALGSVSDGGVAALAAVTRLRRLKLYALGDGVTEGGIAHLASSLPFLEELKVKDCRRVGPTLRSTVVAYRTAAAAAAAAAAGGQPAQRMTALSLAQPQVPMPVVRYGSAECEGGRDARRREA
ncbi:hypothetical protein VOLCADRAFT_98525 [Volvox carteri f. nagariensis]|uniref:Uncharacterized protein n=1 Tax=Volvox carteri f. nagariensis TaxID=3068 RepID=D8UFK4_VOLCA|nr:uncharacterized protein VOLCADRAFT_98525 [Volvox carteri f. nagariensis]EFJ41472.1 hypothetical protein VOLCADRAFT_98525 [Volvox carteri f. nagariensis]|eukprot:XP_002957417.1 hypothetical protein VOLCADRAFT_98525 [Volvox carteri f. nagariensis]